MQQNKPNDQSDVSDDLNRLSVRSIRPKILSDGPNALNFNLLNLNSTPSTSIGSDNTQGQGPSSPSRRPRASTFNFSTSTFTSGPSSSVFVFSKASPQYTTANTCKGTRGPPLRPRKISKPRTASRPSRLNIQKPKLLPIIPSPPTLSVDNGKRKFSFDNTVKRSSSLPSFPSSLGQSWKRSPSCELNSSPEVNPAKRRRGGLTSAEVSNFQNFLLTQPRNNSSTTSL